MVKIISVRDPSKYFYLEDGSSLKNIEDLTNYINRCTLDSFNRHVRNEGNDFANWVRYCLFFPKLADKILTCKNLDDLKNIINGFIKKYNYYYEKIPVSEHFYTFDDEELITLNDLYFYINTCSIGEFEHHVNSSRNDFANWIGNVLKFSDLANKLFLDKSLDGHKTIINNFLLTYKYDDAAVNSDYDSIPKTTISKVAQTDVLKNTSNISSSLNSVSSSAAPKESVSLGASSTIFNSSASSSSVTSNGLASSTIPNTVPITVTAPISSSVSHNVSPINSIAASVTASASPNIASGSSNSALNPHVNSKYAIDMNDPAYKDFKAPHIVIPEVSTKNIPHIIDPDYLDKHPKNDQGLYVFSDDEIEKLTQYGKAERERFQPEEKAQILRVKLLDLKNMIRDLRRQEKDPLIADLLLRVMISKIEFYAISKSEIEFNLIVSKFDEVKKEIDYAATIIPKNFADEVLKDMKLETITVKKLDGTENDIKVKNIFNSIKRFFKKPVEN